MNNLCHILLLLSFGLISTNAQDSNSLPLQSNTPPANAPTTPPTFKSQLVFPHYDNHISSQEIQSQIRNTNREGHWLVYCLMSVTAVVMSVIILILIYQNHVKSQVSLKGYALSEQEDEFIISDGQESAGFHPQRNGINFYVDPEQ